MDEKQNSATGRLSARTVSHLHRLLGGEARIEAMVLRFIANKYGARNLIHLPPKVAESIIDRPWDFIRAAKEHCEPELPIGLLTPSREAAN